MGQCHHCLSGKSNKEIERSHHGRPAKCSQGLTTEQRRESGNDSGHSSAESLSPNRDTRNQRCSQSSESSGKFSFRGSISSPGDPELHHKYIFSDSHPKSIMKGNCNDDLPVFIENGEGVEDEISNVPEVRERRTRGSRGSFSSIGSIGHFFFRSRTAKWSRTTDEDDISLKGGHKKPTRRAVSLRLPRSRHRKDFETKVPTVYVEDEDSLKERPIVNHRKSSLRKALSLLSLNSLNRDNSNSGKPQKPVQRILRPPTKRHTTVRGISGLAIDIRTHADYRTGLQRAHTIVYYPNNTGLRTPLRPTYSNIAYS